MSYAVAAALQAAVFARLQADGGLNALVGAAIYDAVPPGSGTGTFLMIGPEDVRDQSDKTGDGAEHRFIVSVVTDAAGFQAAKAAAVAVSDALVGADLALSRGRLVSLAFLRAVARRTGKDTGRRIDLTFRARVEM
ncbi:MAG: DUF3168 domain-containing protein [Paracoccaceae bacterium]|nr:DUF3168 domain-containing protein [Paracoccaceae bacterium]MDE3237355.1 DUF3168 domain-containing protein [Paracoccaceae bacterium]